MSPKRPDLVLASDIPDVELGVLVCDGLDVEADGGDGGNVLVELELVQDSWSNVSTGGFYQEPECRCRHTRLSGSIQPQHKQAHFL